MARHFDICIRGGGIVGRTLALLLAQERLRVGLVPNLSQNLQMPPGDGRVDVRAYALNHKSKKILESLRCWPENSGDSGDATPVQTMVVHGDDGGQVVFSAKEQGADALAWIVDVAALEARLQQAIQFAPQIEVLGEAPEGGMGAALTVVCEGRASSTRTEFGVDFEVSPYAQCAIAARVACSRPHGFQALQWFDQGDILGVLPMAGNLVAIVWSVEESRAKRLMALDETAFCQGLGEAMRDKNGTEPKHLTLTTDRVMWPLQLARASRWVGPAVSSGPQTRGAWALAGDAAHTVHPLSGQGLNLGLADVAELARHIAKRDYWRGVGDLKILRQYERSRKADAQALAFATDGLQQLFAKPGLPWQRLRNAGMSGFGQALGLKRWVARQAMGI